MKTKQQRTMELGVSLEFIKDMLGVLGVLAVKHWYENIY
jgi:hypothetical protein